MKFIQERPHFKNNFKKIFETRKSLRDDFLRYSSYGESETFLKMANMQMLDSEINFRKSVDDIYYRLKTNPSPTERKENSETTQIFSRKSYISCKNKSNPPPLSFHDKVVCKIKFNKNQKTDNIEHKQLFWNQKIGNRKLMKHLQEITSKYHTQKNEESRMTKTNLSIKRLLTNGDKNNEKDNIDQILIASQNSSSKNTKLMAPFNSKKLNSYSLDPFLWTSKSDI